MTTYDIENEMLDLICWKHYGFTEGSIGNRRLFGFQGVRDESRKDRK
ncbi:tail protein X, partial [Wolbachia endosymbiont of Pentidionis agamae]